MSHPEWYEGLAVDHLYPQCPALRKSLPELRRCFGEPQPRHHTFPIDPWGGDVCGWCLRVYSAQRTPA